MKHPNKEQRDNQKKFLAELPEEQRADHARLFRFGNASYIYHLEAENQEPTETDFKEWLTGLPENIRNDMEIRGFDSCKSVLSFTRYVMEKNDIGMREWMQEHLGTNDYNEYCKMIEEREGR